MKITSSATLVAGLRVNYEVDVDGRVVRALKVITAPAALKLA